MLLYEKHIPDSAADGTPVLILLHGRGSDKNDLMGLQPALPKELAIVAPRAPYPSAEWGYGDGYAWYQYLGGTTPDPTTFERSMGELEAFVAALPGLLLFEPGQLIIGGFSQGGTTATAFAISHPGMIDGVLLFSGFVASHPSVQVTEEAIKGLRMFWGHGTVDGMIPFDFAIKGRAALKAVNMDLETHDYPIDHAISPQELSDAATWLRTFVGQKSSGTS